MGTIRVAALGYDPGYPGIEAVAFGSSRALGDFDALVWNPATLVDEYRDLYTRPGKGEAGPLLSLASSTRLLSDSRRRRAEIERLVERGGVLVVNPWAGPHLRIHAIEDIMTFDPEEVLPRRLRAGVVAMDTGDRAEFRGGQPFRSFADLATTSTPVQCALEAFPGVPLFFGARSGAILGGYLYRHPGHLLVLPRPRPDEHEASTRWHRALLPLLGTLEQRSPAPDLPDWSREIAHPGEAEARLTLRELLSERERLEREIEVQRDRLGDLDRHKALFAGEGHVLVDAVAYVFERAGALVLPELLGRASLVLEHRDRFAVVLVADRAGENDALLRLQDFLDSFMQSFGGTAKGIVVHGRGTPPERSELVDHALQRRLERKGHRYLTGWELFGRVYRSSSTEKVLRDLMAGSEPTAQADHSPSRNPRSRAASANSAPDSHADDHQIEPAKNCNGPRTRGA